MRGTNDSSYLDKLSLYDGSGHTKTTRVFRDPSGWAHLCISVNSGTGTVYYNGESIISGVSGIQALGDVRIAEWINNSHEFYGYMADVYGVEDSALDHTSFTESNDFGGLKPKAYTGSFGTNGFHIDAQPAHDADLLVSSIDRNDGDTLFADCAGHTLTTGGDPEHSIAVGNPFTGDGRAIYFDGTDDYLTVDDGANIDLGTGDFTIEFWMNSDEDTNGDFAMGRWDATPNGGHYTTRQWGIVLSSSGGYGINIYTSAGTNYGTVDTCDSKWHHVAIVRSSGDAKCYLDGKYVIEATSMDSLNMSFSSKLMIGGGQARYWRGAMYDYRISDTARYSSDFDVPTAKFTSDSNTLLLIQPDKDDTTFHDESSSPATVTTVSSPTRTASTPFDAAAKSTAMYFDGTGDNIVAAASSDFAFGTGDFTVEGWWYFQSIPSDTDAMLVDFRPTNSNDTDTFAFSTDLTNGVKVYSGGNFVLGGSLSTNTWHHIALVRDGGTLYAYIDGTATGTTPSFSSNLTANSTPRLGTTADEGTSAVFTGYIFDVRITKGTARYTSNFSSSLQSAPLELNPVYIGGDQSGNKNHFEPTNISTTDIREDNPFKNHATWNPLIKRSSTSNIFTYSEGNTVATYTGGVAHTSTTIASTGVHYAEFAFSGGTSSISGAGVVRARWNDGSADSYTTNYGGCYYGSSGNVASPYGSTSVSAVGSNRLGIAFDGANNKADFYSVTSGGTMTLLKSLTSSDSIDFDGSATFTATSHDTGATSITGYFEAGEWWGTAPSVGSTTASSLNTSNLAAPTVTPSEHFAAKAYEGEGGGEEINLGFTPALTWIKRREDDDDYWHGFYDSVRGLSAGALASNSTNTEDSTQRVASFDSNTGSEGFTLASGVFSYTNTSGKDFISWNWKAFPPPETGASDTRTEYTVKLEDPSDDGWGDGSWYDSATGLPTIYMEVFEKRSSGYVALTNGKIAVQSYDSSSEEYDDKGEQTFTLKCSDLDAIEVRWNYDTQGDGQEWTAPTDYNGYLNEQKITILNGTSSTSGTWVDPSSGSDTTGLSGTNNYNNDDGGSSEYTAPTGWDNENALKTATSTYTGSALATITRDNTSVTPVERFNRAAGFTIIKYTGDSSGFGGTQTLDHSLNVPLDFVIAKARTNHQSTAGGNWVVWHKDLSDYEFLVLNSNASKKTDYYSYEIIEPAVDGTQHQITVNNGYDGSDNYYLNLGSSSGSTPEQYILYGWAGVEGYSKFGTYTGNGSSSDGPMVYTGHTPRWIAIKRINSSDHWCLYDTARFPENPNSTRLEADTADDEVSASTIRIDVLSNGFKLRGAGSTINANNSTYIYAAFAESPFKHANAR